MAIPPTYAAYLAPIREQEQHMIDLVMKWSAINSGSYNLEGLGKMAKALEDNFHWLECVQERVALEPQEAVDAKGQLFQQSLGDVLRFSKRPDAPIQVLLVGHYDTVFPKDHHFQQPVFLDERTLNGPGVTDLKGGLVVMLKALEMLEKSPWAAQLGWEIILNPDEEIGSIGSAPVLEAAARRHHLGLIVEPSLADGTMVSKRKGSGNFTLIVHGRAAHAGRDFGEGRNAIALLAEITQALYSLNDMERGILLNPGIVSGGTTLNTIAALAMLRFNVRMDNVHEMHELSHKIEDIIESFRVRDGFKIELHGRFTRPPKETTVGIARLQKLVTQTAEQLGQELQWKPSGGVCDGNNLAAAGLPNVDTMGVRGGEIHSDREYLIVDSLTERAELMGLLLMRLASGEVIWNKEG